VLNHHALYVFLHSHVRREAQMNPVEKTQFPMSGEEASGPSCCDFGPWLKQQRKTRRFTQEDLAERLACSSALIYKIEAGERTPSIQLSTLIAEWLEIPEIDRAAFLSFARGELKLAAAEVEARFGPASPRRAVNTSKNLPMPLTPLLGRAQEVREAVRLLTEGHARLLTLVGPPGIGKTRLGLRVARELKDRFRDGVLYVVLAAVADPSLVALIIVEALGLRDINRESPLDTLERTLSDKEALLVLDNFEQVLDAAPTIVQLLRACPDLLVLVTSREALHIAGEQQFRVPALATPDPAHISQLPALQSTVQSDEYPAVTLFVQRARAVNPGFVLTEQNVGAVAAICARLQGLPLAIELAAARMNLLSPIEIQSRLDNSLGILESSARHLPEKQRTLRGAIDWSYQLLSEPEKVLFTRLGVFVGGCSLGAAEGVCNATGDLGIDVLAGLASLLNKSLLMREEGAQRESRFTMLELVHDYALERLVRSGQEEEIRQLHAEHYMALAEVTEENLAKGKDQARWLDTLEQEYDNIRSALGWLLDRGHATAALRLAAAMDTYWIIRGRHIEGRKWLERALAAGGDAPDAMRAGALEAGGRLAQSENDHEESIVWLEESLALYRKLGDVAGISRTLRSLASTVLLQGNAERAIALGKEALDLGFEPDTTVETVKLLAVLASAAWFQGDFGQAEEFFAKAVALSRKYEHENEFVLAACLNGLGLVNHYRGHYTRAEALYKESLSIARRIGAPQHIANTDINLAHLALSGGNPSSAEPLLVEGLRLFREMNDKEGISEGLEGMARLASINGQLERSISLFAAAAALREHHSVPLPHFVRTSYDDIVESLRCQMSHEDFTDAWQHGQLMSVEQAADHALALGS
jgi:predicted ATPase/DNA-binding XRE family transcriptional regulator